MTDREKGQAEDNRRFVEEFFAGRGLRTKQSLEARIARLIEMEEGALARHAADPELRDSIEANLDRLDALQLQLESLAADYDAIVEFLTEAQKAGV